MSVIVIFLYILVYINIYIIELPSSIKINEKTGIISGKYSLPLKELYTVTCEYETQKETFNISLVIGVTDYYFKDEHKTNGLVLSNKSTIVKNNINIANDRTIAHCYINLKMENAVYHIFYMSFTRDVVIFGATTDPESDNPNLHCEKGSFSIDIYKYGCILYGNNQDITPKFKGEKNATYEMIYDMKKRIISIKFPNKQLIQIFHDIPSPLYPFIGLYYKNSSIKLVNIEIED